MMRFAAVFCIAQSAVFMFIAYDYGYIAHGVAGVVLAAIGGILLAEDDIRRGR